MKLTIEGCLEEIEEFFSAVTLMFESVPQPAHRGACQKDRKEKEFCPSAQLARSEIQPGEEDRKIPPSRESAATLEEQLGGPPGPKVFHEPKPFYYKDVPALNTGKFTIYQKGELLLIQRQGYGCVLRAKLSDLIYLKEHPEYLKDAEREMSKNKKPILRAVLREVDLASFNDRDSVRDHVRRHDILEDRKDEEKDPDSAFKPMLKGAFSTSPGKEDFDKIETLEVEQ